MRCLVINSYAGSITLGVSSVDGLELRASLEDDDFGGEIQRANFPTLPFYPYRKDWPAWDLSDTIVVAHPPCSAFSLLTSKSARGTNAAAFACTREILDYATERRALAIAIESVMGALNGAWTVHQEYADRCGYHLYRLLENGCMFGAQWRERFWAVWVRKGTADPNLSVTLTPRWSTVARTVGDAAGDAPAQVDLELSRYLARLAARGLDADAVATLLAPRERTRSLDRILWDQRLQHLAYPDEAAKRHAKQTAAREWLGERGFSGGVTVLGARDTSPVLLGSSNWVYGGRSLPERGYTRLMGFPDGYVFPEPPASRRNYRAQMRTYLSKGVMPSIAAWIVENICVHVYAAPRRYHGYEAGRTYAATCPPNGIADLRIRKSDWTPELAETSALPALRHEHDTSEDL